MEESAVAASDVLRWAETLSAIARTGLGFTQSLYEQERFEEVLHVAGDMKASIASSSWMRASNSASGIARSDST